MPTTRPGRERVFAVPTPDGAARLAATLGLILSITSYHGACVVWVVRDGETGRELAQWVEVPTGNWRVGKVFGQSFQWQTALRGMATALGRDVIRITGVAG